MTEDQQERLVAAWEGVARGLGELNETARRAISKQWPDSRERSDAIVTRIPTAEDKIRAQTGNTTEPIEEWLSGFDDDDDKEEMGPREKEFLARQAKNTRRTKASAKARGSDAAGA